MWTNRAEDMQSGLVTAKMLNRADALLKKTQNSPNKRQAQAVYHAVQRLHDNKDISYFYAISKLKRFPVDIMTFIEDEDFLGNQMQVWPALKEDLKQVNKEIFIGEEHTHELILGGSTGSGKTVTATVTNLYHIYLLTCLNYPQDLFKLSRPTPIMFIFQSVSPRIAERTIYKPFREIFESIPFNKKFVEWDRRIRSELHIDQNIQAIATATNINAFIGQAVIGGILDEVNFLARVENSKQAIGPEGQSATFDQAEQVYTNISRRRKSRFITKGPSPGIICVVSSSKYKGDFIERRIRQLEKKPEENVKVITHKQYDVVPQERFCGRKFRLLVGTDLYQTRPLSALEIEGVHYPKGAQVEEIPIEYLVEFQKDPDNALRDIVGIPSNAISAFVSKRDKVRDCIDENWVNWVDKDNYILRLGEFPTVVLANLPEDKEKKRYVHIDLSLTGDRTGVAIVSIDDHASDQDNEFLPSFTVECAFTLEPDPAHPVEIADVRRFIARLKRKYGINIARVSYDGFNSAESIQLLRRSGIISFNLSVDRKLEPYENFRRAIYEDRVDLPNIDLLYYEIIGLELNSRKGKVDHSLTFSKDLSDAVCGAIENANRSGQAREMFEVELTSDYQSTRPTTSARPHGSGYKRKTPLVIPFDD